MHAFSRPDANTLAFVLVNDVLQGTGSKRYAAVASSVNATAENFREL